MSTCDRVGLLLVPSFSMMALSAVSEPLRAANLLSGRTLYEWSIISLDGRPVASSSGFELLPAHALADAPVDFDLVIVVASLNVKQHATQPLLNWLRRAARHGTPIAGISTASYLLARAGLLEGRRCTIHWEMLRTFQESFPDIPVERALYVIDDGRLTCAGGTAALDLMLQIISDRHGAELAAGVAENFLHSRIRSAEESQRMSVQWRFGISDARLAKAIGFMEANMEEPLSPAAVADLVGVSSRQLERLFQKHFQQTPARFYLELRLKQARTLLRQSTESIQEIAYRCGFSSVSHFGRAYREVYGATPARTRGGTVASASSGSA